MNETNLKTRVYTYPSLVTLKPNTVVDVYGIVIFHKLPAKTRGTDYLKIVTIVDESLIDADQKLKCLLFSRDEESLPHVEIGNIVRFHRLRINLHNEELQGLSGSGFSWLVIDGPSECCINRKASSLNYTFTDVDREKIKELFYVEQKNKDLSSKNLVKTLEQLEEGIYFDFICQVVAVSAIEKNVCYLLQVWDGTRPSCSIYTVDTVEKNLIVKTDMGLMQVAKDWLVDVCVFNDHYQKAATIKPRMFLKFFNLHCQKHKNTELISSVNHEEMELNLHQGSSFGRGVKILSETDPEINALKKRLEDLTKNMDRTCTSTNQHAEPDSSSNNVERNVETVGQCSSPSKMMSQTLNDTSVEITTNSLFNIENHVKDSPEIVLSSVTVIQGHESVKLSHFCDIINYTVPMKFRLCARVVNYIPKLSNVSDFLSLFCPQCDYITAINKYKLELSTFHIKDGVEYYCCPYCAKKNISNDIPLMEYTFLLKFLLTDGLYYIFVNLWKDEAVKFFNNITPLEFITDADVVNKVKSYLERINSSDGDCQNLPVIECCIRSFNGEDSVCYEMFDTLINV